MVIFLVTLNLHLNNSVTYVGYSSGFFCTVLEHTSAPCQFFPSYFKTTLEKIQLPTLVIYLDITFEQVSEFPCYFLKLY